MSDKQHWKEFQTHRAAARKEVKSMFSSLLPESFWVHARASRREARLACTAFRRALKKQFTSTTPKKPTGKEKIEIA